MREHQLIYSEALFHNCLLGESSHRKSRLVFVDNAQNKLTIWKVAWAELNKVVFSVTESAWITQIILIYFLSPGLKGQETKFVTFLRYLFLQVC